MRFLKVSLPEEIVREEGLGNFKRAKRLVRMWLDRVSEPIVRERLEYELERIDRMVKSYPHSFERAFDLLSKELEGLTLSEFEKLLESGYLDYRVIEGELRFESRFVPNLFWAKPDLERRRKRVDRRRERARSVLRRTAEEMVKRGGASARIRMKAGLRITKRKIPGKRLRVWIPVPRVGDQIKSSRIVETSPRAKHVSAEDHTNRTVYFEEKVGCCREFEVVYEYEVELVYRRPKFGSSFVNVEVGHLDELEPHVVFHPLLREITEKVVGGLEDPISKAKAIYDFITGNVRYSYVREYSTYENIPLFVLSNMKGDCGMQALLFITMCRIAGIPAGWQSGLYVNTLVSPHDWAVFHVEPFGWMFADLSFGGSWRGDELMHEFYFGNLDPYRMVANSEFQGEFDPPKEFYRSDPYDNQRGEVETDLQNLYYDSFKPYWEILDLELR